MVVIAAQKSRCLYTSEQFNDRHSGKLHGIYMPSEIGSHCLCVYEITLRQGPSFISCGFCTTVSARQSFYFYNNTDTLYFHNNTNALTVYVVGETTKVRKAESYCSHGDLDKKTLGKQELKFNTICHKFRTRYYSIP